MTMRMVVASTCFGSLMIVSSVYGQSVQNGSFPFSRYPCPGGAGAAIPDGPDASAIHDLIQISELIIKGTVVRVLPSEVIDPNPLNMMHTTSLISVDEVLRGTPPPSNTIAITQLGGRVGACSLTVEDNPIVELHEEYILFLVRDQQPHIPNNSGSPRYVPYGVYGGKAKIVNGKIQFSPSAPAGLREYDNTEIGTFKDIVKRGGDVRKVRRDVPPGLITPRTRP